MYKEFPHNESQITLPSMAEEIIDGGSHPNEKYG
jgi:hypothetical protein